MDFLGQRFPGQPLFRHQLDDGRAHQGRAVQARGDPDGPLPVARHDELHGLAYQQGTQPPPCAADRLLQIICHDVKIMKCQPGRRGQLRGIPVNPRQQVLPGRGHNLRPEAESDTSQSGAHLVSEYR
jgi:hypothetical protein